MTDFEAFCGMLARSGIKHRIQINGNFYKDSADVTAAELAADSDGVSGYEGFKADFTFDRQTGALSHVYIWE